MKWSRSATIRLTLTYLGIIMAMSIGFSIVLYRKSSGTLGHQLPPAYVGFNEEEPARRVRTYVEQRLAEGRADLRDSLILLNILVLVGGAGISYLLARRSLEPIEEAVEAQNQFVSDASHELRTPLTALQLENEVALRQINLTLDGAKSVLASNIEEIHKLKDLSEGLLTLATQEHQDLVLQPLKLAHAIKAAVQDVTASAEAKDITITQKLAKDLLVVGNETALKRLFVIILDNAIKYSPPKTVIQITAAQEGKRIIISFADQGPGIAAKDLPHIFQRFYRADASRNKQTTGFGLGLAIGKTIVEQHKGTIKAQNNAPQGTIIKISLPA